MTQYERGTKLERDLQHLWEYRGWYVMRSAGSHGLADLAVVQDSQVFLVQCKLHNKLRDKEREKELKHIPKPVNCIPMTAWKEKQGRNSIICLHTLNAGQDIEIEPLTKEQEKKYQEMKKAKIEARKSTNVRVLSGVRQTKTTK
jgi:Holliday junction resolvase